MPALKNIRREAFAQQFAQDLQDPKVRPQPSKAYQKTYGASKHVAEVNASKLMAVPDVRARVQELLEKDKRTSLKGLSKKLAELTEAEREGVQLAATKLGFELHGAVRGMEVTQNNGTFFVDAQDANVLFQELVDRVCLTLIPSHQQSAK